MDALTIKRMDHHGLVMGVIKDLGLIDAMDERLGRFDDEKTSVGERVAALILNGLGFTDSPISLVADFFEELPVDVLFGRSLEAKDFNRFSLSRCLDRVSDYGDAQLFTELAAIACQHEGVNVAHQSFDTTSFSATGEGYNEDSCEIKVTHGYSKDHRPDLKQVVTELLVTHDGGIPLHMKNWSGNASDTTIFKQRTEQLIESFTQEFCDVIVADSKFYTKGNSVHWNRVTFITRVPDSIHLTQSYMDQAYEHNNWQTHDSGLMYHLFAVNHYDTDQRWLVCRSEQSYQRAEKTVNKRVNNEKSLIDKAIFHLQAKRFSCEQDARDQAKQLSKSWKYHRTDTCECVTHKHYKKKGKPSKDDVPESITYQVKLSYLVEDGVIEKTIQRKACFVLASNADQETMSDTAIVTGYKQQQTVERGYRFLKDPHFFTSALFLKKPSRISALIMVMTLALLVYTIAQRRLKKALIDRNETLPDQIKKPTKKITMRWAFRLLRGVNLVRHTGQDWVVNGMSELKRKVIYLIGGFALTLYQLQAQDAMVDSG